MMETQDFLSKRNIEKMISDPTFDPTVEDYNVDDNVEIMKLLKIRECMRRNENSKNTFCQRYEHLSYLRLKLKKEFY